MATVNPSGAPSKAELVGVVAEKIAAMAGETLDERNGCLKRLDVRVTPTYAAGTRAEFTAKLAHLFARHFDISELKALELKVDADKKPAQKDEQFAATGPSLAREEQIEFVRASACQMIEGLAKLTLAERKAIVVEILPRLGRCLEE